MLKLIAKRPNTSSWVARVFSGTTRMRMASTTANVATGRWPIRIQRVPTPSRAAGTACAVLAMAFSDGGTEQARRAHQEHESHQREDRHLSHLREKQTRQAIDHADQ